MTDLALPEAIRELGARFAQHGAPLYLVGGAVRDMLLGLPAADFDLAGPAADLAFLQELGISCQTVNRHTGTSQIHFMDTTFEYTAFRRESYGHGHSPAEVSLGATMEEDALRRDFSVNALYIDACTGALHDPTGRGLEDISRRRLRTTTENPLDIIADDGLRLLRLARFACTLDFSIDRTLFLAARQNAALLDEISCERIAGELCRILLADVGQWESGCRARRVHRGLLLLRALGLLRRIFPELMAGDGMAQLPKYHKYTVLYHSICTCAAAPPVLELRLAALLHDVGKPDVFARTGRMLGHDAVGADMAGNMLRRMRFPAKTMERVQQLVALHMYDINGNTRTSTLRRFAARWGRDTLLALACLREADVWGSGIQTGPVASAERFRQTVAEMDALGLPWSVRDLPINGADLLHLGFSGPAIGWALEKLLFYALTHPYDREKLLQNARMLRLNLPKSFAGAEAPKNNPPLP